MLNCAKCSEKVSSAARYWLPHYNDIAEVDGNSNISIFHSSAVDRIRHCGLCVSGQSIHSAAKRLKNVSNKKIIINIGSIDILHGQQSIDMQHDFKNLVQICKYRNIDLTITTLAPLANVNHNPDIRDRVDSFNNFLIKNYSQTHKVIDIRECMVGQRGETLYDCYQP